MRQVSGLGGGHHDAPTVHAWKTNATGFPKPSTAAAKTFRRHGRWSAGKAETPRKRAASRRPQAAAPGASASHVQRTGTASTAAESRHCRERLTRRRRRSCKPETAASTGRRGPADDADTRAGRVVVCVVAHAVDVAGDRAASETAVGVSDVLRTEFLGASRWIPSWSSNSGWFETIRF